MGTPDTKTDKRARFSCSLQHIRKSATYTRPSHVWCPQSKFATFQTEMRAHLDEEETDIVPAMRQNFKQEEERKVQLTTRL